MRRAMGAIALAALLASGCEKLARNMYDGARHRPLDAPAVVVPAPGAVARTAGLPAGTSSGRAGDGAVQRRLQAEAAASLPAPITMQLLRRGQERYDIYCEPCHGAAGDGDGMVARRGFPRPPSYHEARLRAAPDRHYYDVIAQGYGVMYPYGDRVAPEDRWAIVAYIRALQRAGSAR